MIVLLMLMFGVIQVSWAVYSYHLIANAAHEGARYAIVRGSSWGSNCASWNSSQCTASTDDIANYVANRSLPGVSIAASNVCVQYFSSVPSSTSTSCTANTSPNDRGDIVQVTVSNPLTLNVIWWSRTFSVSSTSQMVIAQ